MSPDRPVPAGPTGSARPRVAVAVPTKARARWCEEAVRSALAQDGVDVEVAVAIDGDDAETRARLAALGDARVRVVAGAPAGRPATRNRAVRATTAALVAFLDDDDRLLPGSLRARAEALERHPAAPLAYGDPVATDAQGNVRRPVAPDDGRRPRASLRDGLRDHLRGRSPFPSSALVRRDAFERAGGFDEDLPTGEDWAFFLRLSSAGPFVHVAGPTVLYRKHPGQARGDPRSQEAALPAWTSRYFDDPALPPSVRRYRGRLVGTHLNWIARNHRAAGDEASARRCFRAAVRENPRLLLHPKRALRFLRLAFARPPR